MGYRLIALDVDGTLLNDHHVLTERTKETVRRAQDQGARIVLCTGRGPLNAIPVLEELGLEGVLIAHNGASTVQTPGPAVLHEFHYRVQELAPLIEYCRARGVHFDVNTSLTMYIESATDAAAAMYEQFLAYPQQVDDVLALQEPIVKLSLFGAEQQIDEVEQEFFRIGLPDTLHQIRSGAHFIDVMTKAASKGNALRELAALWDIPREDILAIGNYFNDMDMIRFAGLGIAMDNSPDAVKEAADVTTVSNNEDGVHVALSRYVLGTAESGISTAETPKR